MSSNPVIVRAAEALRKKIHLQRHGLEAVVDLAALVANADGTIDDAEMATLEASMKVLLGEYVSDELAHYLVIGAIEAIKSAGVEARTRTIGEMLGRDGAAEEGITLAIAIALSNGDMTAEERALIDAVATAAQLPPARVDALVAQVRGSK